MTLFISIVIIAACSNLSWYLFTQHAKTLEHSLEHLGTLITSNLARNSRYAVITEDVLTLEQLVDTSMKIKEVAYVTITGADGTNLIHKSKKTITSHPIHTLESFESDSTSQLITKFHTQTGKQQTIEVHRGKAGKVTSTFQAEAEQLYDFAFPIKKSQAMENPLGLFSEMPATHINTNPNKIIGIIQVGINKSEIEQSLRTLVRDVIAITIIIILAGIAVTVILSNHIILPIKRLASAQQLVTEGNFTTNVPPTSKDEIGELTFLFNTMTTALQERDKKISEAYKSLEQFTKTLEDRVKDRTSSLEESNRLLQKLDKQRVLFVNDLSHAIKNPLGTIELSTQNMLDGIYGDPTDAQRKTLEMLLAVIKRLTRNIEKINLLEAPEAIQFTPCNLINITTEIIKSFESITSRQAISIEVSNTHNIPLVSGDEDSISEILTNIIGNALKFTPRNKTISINFELASDAFVTTTVTDKGHGILPEEIDNIFDRMFQGTNIVHESRGWGIGLAITKALVELHGGKIWVKSIPNQGSSFSFTLPI